MKRDEYDLSGFADFLVGKAIARVYKGDVDAGDYRQCVIEFTDGSAFAVDVDFADSLVYEVVR